MVISVLVTLKDALLKEIGDNETGRSGDSGIAVNEHSILLVLFERVLDELERLAKVLRDVLRLKVEDYDLQVGDIGLELVRYVCGQVEYMRDLVLDEHGLIARYDVVADVQTR